tara:strand:- start:915 stop:1112 length:198 start_codon:yes stop_codon:yes gene_type:complete
MGYYKTIDGVKYDGELIELAEKLTSGGGDGRLSKAVAGQIIEAVKDGDIYTDTEKATVKYLRDNL